MNPTWRKLLIPGLVAASCSACAQKQADGEGLRALVQVREPATDVRQMGDRLSRIAGLPVRDVQAVSPVTVSLTLVCDDAARCDAGLRRLVAASDVVVDAQPEAMKRLPRPVSPSSPSAR